MRRLRYKGDAYDADIAEFEILPLLKEKLTAESPSWLKKVKPMHGFKGKEPTALQSRVLSLLRSSEDLGLPCPTIREIQAAFGWKSPFAASRVLDALQKKGLLSRNPKKARNIQTT